MLVYSTKFEIFTIILLCITTCSTVVLLILDIIDRYNNEV